MAAKKFPENFKFGIATSAHQIEGAWNKHGKCESIWDYQTHNFPHKIADNSNADHACDSYNNLDEDIANLRFLGVQFYRFSLSWCRILPSGFPGKANQPGIDYYNQLIDKLLEAGIEPMATIYHWDLPQKLQELGGWTNPLMADYFVHYARVCFEKFGDRVKMWLTFNEPMQICYYAYSAGILAPFYQSKGMASYLAGHTLLLAHGRAYRMYERDFKEVQKGKVGITIEAPWAMPGSDRRQDLEASDRFLHMYFGWFAHPIFSKTGDYPPVMRKRIDTLSKAQGLPKSRLPKFTTEEIALLKGSSDFCGLNHYTTWLISDITTQWTNSNPEKSSSPSEEEDHGCAISYDPTWTPTARDAFKVVPAGMRAILNWIRAAYNNPEVIITENGYAGESDEGLDDFKRIDYMHLYLENVLNAIGDGCNVVAYTAWTLMDNYEWSDGYTMRFGLFHNDFDIVRKNARQPKKSAYFYRQIIKNLPSTAGLR